MADSLTYEAALDIVIEMAQEFLDEYGSDKQEAALMRVRQGRDNAAS